MNANSVNIPSDFLADSIFVQSVLPGIESLPTYQTLKTYLEEDFLDDHPEMSLPYNMKVNILGKKSQILMDAYCFYCKEWKSNLEAARPDEDDGALSVSISEMTLQSTKQFLFNQVASN